MEKLHFRCPNCDVHGSVPGETIEQGPVRLRCPRCGATFSTGEVVAAPTPAVPPAPEEQPAAEVTGAGKSVPAPTSVPAPADTGPVPVPPAQSASSFRFSFHGDGRTLFSIQFVNLLLTIVTIGFYRFWGKVKVRNYLYSQTELLGERLAYHGTGRELLVGWLKAMGVIFVIYLVLTFLQMVHPLFVIPMNVGFLALVGYAKVGTMRYRLSRTSWRSIRLSFRGGYKEGVWLHVWGLLAVFFSLGLYYPFFHVRLRRFWADNSYFGNQPFRYEGEGRELFKDFLIAVLLSVLTLGVYWIWFKASLARYDWQRTSYPGLSLRSEVTGGALFKLTITNLLILLFTLGLGLPWVIVRTLHFQFEYISLSGKLDYEKIRQEAIDAGATAEGFLDYMDMDGGLLDFGIL